MSQGAERPRPAVLVVDDNPDVRRLVVVALRKRYEVLEAGSGTEAMSILAERMGGPAERYVRAVLVDILMPGMDGLTLCEAIKARYDVPVLMLTAAGTASNLRTAVAKGADDYVLKPFTQDLLLAKVGIWVHPDFS